MASTGDDPFGEFLQQDDADSVTVPSVGYPVHESAAPAEPTDQLRLLVESSLRQEQLLGKVCSLLVGLDEKIATVASNQQRLEATMQRAVIGGGGGGGGSGLVGAPLPTAKAGGGPRDSGSRGALVQPPGTAPLPGGNNAANSLFGEPSQSFNNPRQTASQAAGLPDDRFAANERLAAERLRIEDEARRRADELARQREYEEQRQREEAERRRIEEDRRREEERVRKAELEKKTSGLMNNLITGNSGGGLFGDDDGAPKKKGGGLFDD